MEARRILAKQGWTEGHPKTADIILVVVRSGLYNPLNSHYETYGEMKQDAESQLNIAGENFHIYIFTLGDDLDCTQIKHVSYKADD